MDSNTYMILKCNARGPRNVRSIRRPTCIIPACSTRSLLQCSITLDSLCKTLCRYFQCPKKTPLSGIFHSEYDRPRNIAPHDLLTRKRSALYHIITNNNPMSRPLLITSLQHHALHSRAIHAPLREKQSKVSYCAVYPTKPSSNSYFTNQPTLTRTRY